MSADAFSSNAMPGTIQNPRQQFLQFTLEPDTNLILPLFQLTEILTVPLGQITPIPHMPPWTMGVHNWRGEVLWVIDFGAFLGLTPWNRQLGSRTNYRVIILNGAVPFDSDPGQRRRSPNQRNQMVGLVVTSVGDITWCETDRIQSPPPASVNAELAPYVRGFWVSQDGAMHVVLDGQAVTERLAAHS
ncbi:chemotaxis protein CheW [Synechocystis sp. PCC 6714]|uniref:chemotaxis protein CheW n=1 Tax=Synechocystis sp. (strain PCC 6714) TaxID=1147 RepID=UPI0004D114A0|nr:chemotaxis protein CheW [Synechocystis sp. PCC 6714]AIE73269.1 Purine-binding chemotaxis protein [Synechocystis sp. PCC 6714]